MPTYQYLCKNCGHQLEELQSIKEPPLTQCPECKQEALLRIVGSGSGVIFKGTGFYKTDYVKSERNEAKSSGAEEKKKDSGTPSPAADTKTPPASPSDSGKKKDEM
ncbi:MAG: zinc ribbon domain-containing protein [Bacteroidetes bacterium]|nr:zinc ribbon domain-containing protein [Bacteroidota bacterium]MCW5895968.1 zinc ribbon domain-containing protein [Bacteroidota bacterium]